MTTLNIRLPGSIRQDLYWHRRLAADVESLKGHGVDAVLLFHDHVPAAGEKAGGAEIDMVRLALTGAAVPIILGLIKAWALTVRARKITIQKGKSKITLQGYRDKDLDKALELIAVEQPESTVVEIVTDTQKNESIGRLRSSGTTKPKPALPIAVKTPKGDPKRKALPRAADLESDDSDRRAAGKNEVHPDGKRPPQGPVRSKPTK